MELTKEACCSSQQDVFASKKLSNAHNSIAGNIKMLDKILFI